MAYAINMLLLPISHAWMQHLSQMISLNQNVWLLRRDGFGTSGNRVCCFFVRSVPPFAEKKTTTQDDGRGYPWIYPFCKKACSAGSWWCSRDGEEDGYQGLLYRAQSSSQFFSLTRSHTHTLFLSLSLWFRKSRFTLKKCYALHKTGVNVINSFLGFMFVELVCRLNPNRTAALFFTP